MIGKTQGELAELATPVIEEALGGLQPESQHAAVLCVDGVRALLKRCNVLRRRAP